MASSPTYYDFFGVSRTASADEIRSAYLWLMKQYHPDLTDGAERDRAADYAAILNDRTHGGILGHHHRVGHYFHRFGDLADLQFEIDPGILLDLNFHLRSD